MKENSIRILSTRPLSEALINKASEHNILIDTISFIETRSIVDDAIKQTIKSLSQLPVAVIFTSMNGADAVIESLKEHALQPQWKIYCMGAATQTIIKDYFTNSLIRGIGKNAIELAEAVVNDEIKEAVFFCGNQRRDELPQKLRASNVSLREIVVYETIETTRQVDKEYSGILFFSPSSVRSFFTSNKIVADTVLFAIGNTTADAVKEFSCNQIIMGDYPAKEELVEEVIRYFNPVKQH